MILLSNRALMRRMRLDVWDIRGFDYKSGIGAKYVGPKSSRQLPPEPRYFSIRRSFEESSNLS
ncbi:MAG: hypothetical protein O3A84_11675 [Proteobacteria bacterium]|nr:hypothetical protein [Pseudomonadota bacterium]